MQFSPSKPSREHGVLLERLPVLLGCYGLQEERWRVERSVLAARRATAPDAAGISVGDETHHGSGEQSRRRGREHRDPETAQPGCTCTCCGRGRTAERAHVRDEEQQREREGGQHGREQTTCRGAGEGALRGPDLGGGFEAEEDGRVAEENGLRRAGGACGREMDAAGEEAWQVARGSGAALGA